MTLTLDKRTPENASTLSVSSGITETITSLIPPSETKQGETIMAETLRFGTIEVEPDLLLHFPTGVIGFETCTRFTIISQGDSSQTSWRWLQSLDLPALAFPIMEPWDIRPDYTATLSDYDTLALGITDTDPTLLFVIVTVPAKNPREMTANLIAPIVINVATQEAKQVIVQETEYTTRHLIVDEIERAKTVRTMAISGVRAKAA